MPAPTIRFICTRGPTVKYHPINFAAKLSCFSDLWSPKIIAGLNDYHIKLAKIQGEFVWHSHPETDEAFLVLKGAMSIEFRDGRVDLQEGELFVGPKGVAHRAIAPQECHIMLIESAGTVNTDGENTAAENEWI